WTARRVPEQEDRPYGRHVQVESRMSLTGSNADRRIVLTPAQAARLLDGLAGELAARAGTGKPEFGLGGALPPPEGAVVAELADELWAARGRSLLVCGANDVRQQCAANFVNHVLGNYGNTLDVGSPSQQRAGDDAALQRLLARLRAGE